MARAPVAHAHTDERPRARRGRPGSVAGPGSDGDPAQLPVMLLLGVSTTAQIVHELLPSPALTRLSTERFELPSAAASLDQLIQQLFSSRPFGFRLGAKSFRYVVDSYLYQHVSVHQLMRALQVPAPSIRPA